MRQSDLEREVARATGESVTAIRRLGFSLDQPSDDPDFEEKFRSPQYIDWDEHEAQRNNGTRRRPCYVPTAA